MSYQLHPEAEADLTDAAQYYAKEASVRVAHAFLDEFERVAGLLERTPQLGKSAKAGLRIFPFHRFPYSLVYRDSREGPFIYAVAHQKREPNYWATRI